MLTTALDSRADEPRRPVLVAGAGTPDKGGALAGPDGAEYRLPGGNLVRFAPGSVFRIFGATQDLVLRPGSKTPTWSVVLNAGRVDVTMSDQASPSAVFVSVGNRGGGIVLAGRMAVVTDGASTVVANRDGEVLSGAGSYWKSLSAGMQRVLSERQSSTIAPIVKTPSFAKLPRIFLARHGELELQGLHWAAVPGAAGYAVELEDENGTVELRHSTTTRLERSFGALKPGAYRLRISAFDARGIESGWSEPVPLRVVGVALPPGAYTDAEGVIHLAPGQQVALEPVSGVEMSYTGKGPFAGAARSLGLIRGEPRTVWLRPRGSSSAEPLKLVPRSFSADIQLGPRKAVWPRDAVTVRVRLKDGVGKALPSWVKPTTKVSIGVTPVEVSWRRDRDTLYATVPAPATPGPWVVRVEVLDQYQIPLGYDFLEIARAAPESDSRKLSAR